MNSYLRWVVSSYFELQMSDISRGEPHDSLCVRPRVSPQVLHWMNCKWPGSSSAKINLCKWPYHQKNYEKRKEQKEVKKSNHDFIQQWNDELPIISPELERLKAKWGVCLFFNWCLGWHPPHPQFLRRNFTHWGLKAEHAGNVNQSATCPRLSQMTGSGWLRCSHPPIHSFIHL